MNYQLHGRQEGVTMDRKRTFPPIVGISSLLVIFSALCLTVFTLLTISTARAERRLSDVSAEAVSAYYNAGGYFLLHNGDVHVGGSKRRRFC